MQERLQRPTAPARRLHFELVSQLSALAQRQLFNNYPCNKCHSWHNCKGVKIVCTITLLADNFCCIVSCCLKRLKRRSDAASAHLQQTTKMIFNKDCTQIGKTCQFHCVRNSVIFKLINAERFCNCFRKLVNCWHMGEWSQQFHFKVRRNILQKK